MPLTRETDGRTNPQNWLLKINTMDWFSAMGILTHKPKIVADCTGK